MDNPLYKAIDHFKGITALAVAIKEKQSTVSMWNKRNSVPSKHWLKIEIATDSAVTTNDFLQYEQWTALGNKTSDNFHQRSKKPRRKIDKIIQEADRRHADNTK
jgi:flagellar biosynthesis chaperone FliJ